MKRMPFWSFALLLELGCSDSPAQEPSDAGRRALDASGIADVVTDMDSEVDVKTAVERDGNAKTSAVGDTGTNPHANVQKNAQLCRALDSDACAQISGCERLYASLIDPVQKCLGKREPVGCWLTGYGCAAAITVAIDDRGQCWFFSCLNVPKRMTDLFGSGNTIIERCGVGVDDIGRFARCEDSGTSGQAETGGADSGPDSCGDPVPAAVRLAPGRIIVDPQTEGTGSCAGTTLSEFLISAKAANPEISPSTYIYDPNALRIDGMPVIDSTAVTYAYQKSDGGFAFVFKAGSGDCESGCINNEYWYVTSDAVCAPKQVGHYKPIFGDGGCYVDDGTPMWGRPEATDPIFVCGADLTPQKIAGTYHFTSCGQYMPCKREAISATVPPDITMVVAQDDANPASGIVTVQGTGVSLIDGKAIPATFIRKRFRAKESFSTPPSLCRAEHDIVVNYDFEEFEQGLIQLFEMDTPDCANPSDYCKGSLQLSLQIVP